MAAPVRPLGRDLGPSSRGLPRSGERAGERGSGIELSVVVPTRNEASSVALLLHALRTALAGFAAEVLFVDDSSDETPVVIRREAARCAFPVRVLHREPRERAGGLGGAVKAGFAAAAGEFVAVMDADLQHPPVLLRSLLACARSGLAHPRSGAELVVASRFVDTGSVGEFGALRRFVSRGSAALAKLLFPRRLAAVSDPMSGFFLARRDLLPVEALRPQGFKILLEVLVCSRPLRVAEVPYTFGGRFAGESKASLREGMRYLRHLLRLRLSGSNGRLIKFSLVGLVGLLVNMALLAVLTEAAGLYYLASALIATEASIASNFALSELWVFDHGAAATDRFARFVAFAVVNNLAFALSGPLLWLLVSVLGLHYLLGNLCSIGALMLVRFLAADKLIWRPRPARAAVAPNMVRRRRLARVIGLVASVLC